MHNLTKTAKMELIELFDVPTITYPELTAIQHDSEYNGFVRCKLSHESYAMILPESVECSAGLGYSSTDFTDCLQP